MCLLGLTRNANFVAETLDRESKRERESVVRFAEPFLMGDKLERFMTILYFIPYEKKDIHFIDYGLLAIFTTNSSAP